jgi:WD40 repeat protein
MAFTDSVRDIQWSPDGHFILISVPKRNLAFVKSIDDPEWSCKIDEGVCGLSYARWTPDSRQVITITEFNLRLTVWSLTDKNVSYIKNPKFADKGLSFTSNGKFMALAERENCKDFIGIYYCGDWKLMNHFQVETVDLAGLAWSKDDTSIVCWDNVIECRVLIYSATQGLI